MKKHKGNMVASKTPSPAIDIPGMQVAKEAKKKGSGFKAGGKVGFAEGGAPMARMDQAPRKASGGSMRGRSPFSAASSPKEPGGGSKSGAY